MPIYRLQLEDDDMEPGETRVLARLPKGSIILDKAVDGIVTLSTPNGATLEALEGAVATEIPVH